MIVYTNIFGHLKKEKVSEGKKNRERQAALLRWMFCG